MADRDPAVQAAAEQLGAALGDAIVRGLARGLAKQLSQRTLTSGPWLLHADGTITNPEEDTAP